MKYCSLFVALLAACLTQAAYADNCKAYVPYMGIDRHDKYEGDCVNGLANGKGIHIIAGGHRYEGEFKNGSRHGKGVYISHDGTIKEGEWKNGELSGKGIRSRPKEVAIAQGLDKNGTGKFVGNKYIEEGIFDRDAFKIACDTHDEASCNKARIVLEAKEKRLAAEEKIRKEKEAQAAQKARVEKDRRNQQACENFYVGKVFKSGWGRYQVLGVGKTHVSYQDLHDGYTKETECADVKMYK